MNENDIQARLSVLEQRVRQIIEADPLTIVKEEINRVNSRRQGGFTLIVLGEDIYDDIKHKMDEAFSSGYSGVNLHISGHPVIIHPKDKKACYAIGLK